VKDLVIRKLISALATTVVMVILYTILEEFGVGLFLGMYILPILLFYGVPCSILSDYLTRRSGGYKRMVAAALLHVLLGALFVAIPTLIFEQGSWLTSFWNNAFFFLNAAVSSFIFWCLDELIKSKWFSDVRGKCLVVLRRIGDLRI
jgi:MFS family permease